MIKIKRNSLIILVICMFLLVGCKKDVDLVNTSNNKDKYAEDPSQNINVKGSGELQCSRGGNAINGLTAEFNYYLVYKKGILVSLHSIEKVSGDDQDALDQYEEAYKKIKKNYENIKYYDTNVIRDKKSVTNDININYAKVDTVKIMKIEGNNIYNDKNQPTLKKWLDLAKKAGVTCRGVIN